MWNLDFRAPGLKLDVQELVARAWPQASPKQRNAAISAGEVRIAGEVTREAKARVAPGSRVQVVAREGQLISSPPAIEILQRGQDFCVVDKPTGWPSHAATAGGPDARALVAASLDCSINEIWPVHRLDADVSGAWLIALTQEAASRLSTSFAQDLVTKEYRALAPRLPWREGRFRAGVDGKAAETIFRVLSGESEDTPARDPHPEICEVSLTLVTGRTHQLRRHLAGARCPILGDNLYGGAMVAGGLRLYSRRIEIQDQDVNATAPEPAGYAVEEPIYSTSDEPAEITVSHATAVALERGHPWILTDTETTDVGGLRPGSVVHARSARGKAVGECRIEGPGKITARLWSRQSKRQTDSMSVPSRVKAALARRRDLMAGFAKDQRTTSYRLIHGEADALPGLMIDRVGNELRVLSMWRGSQAFEASAIDALLAELEEDLPVVMVRHIVDRPKGQFLSTEAYRGTPSEKTFSVRERGLTFQVDTGLGEPLRSRPGFGLYIDQRANRDRIAKLVRKARGGRWLNLFCHTGAFSVAALDAGAEEVTSVDLSRPYLATLEHNLELNDMGSDRHQTIKMDVQRFVEKWPVQDCYHGIIIDPPTAAAAGKQFWSVRKGQARLVEECLRHLVPGGSLLVCRNDQGAKDKLQDLVNASAVKAGAPLRSIHDAGPGADFPTLKGFREGTAFDGVLAIRK